MANDLTTIVQSGELEGIKSATFLHSFDVKNKKELKLMAIAINGAPPSLQEAVNTELDIVHILIHRVRVFDQTSGELKDLIRTVAVTKDGKIFSACGDAARKGFLLPVAMGVASLPYQPPQRFKITRQKCVDGNKFYLNVEWVVQ